MDIKEMLISAFEDLENNYLDAGLSRKEAQKRAEREAYDVACDRAADQADFLRHAAKEG